MCSSDLLLLLRRAPGIDETTPAPPSPHTTNQPHAAHTAVGTGQHQSQLARPPTMPTPTFQGRRPGLQARRTAELKKTEREGHHHQISDHQPPRLPATPDLGRRRKGPKRARAPALSQVRGGHPDRTAQPAATQIPPRRTNWPPSRRRPCPPWPRRAARDRDAPDLPKAAARRASSPATTPPSRARHHHEATAPPKNSHAAVSTRPTRRPHQPPPPPPPGLSPTAPSSGGGEGGRKGKGTSEWRRLGFRPVARGSDRTKQIFFFLQESFPVSPLDSWNSDGILLSVIFFTNFQSFSGRSKWYSLKVTILQQVKYHSG